MIFAIVLVLALITGITVEFYENIIYYTFPAVLILIAIDCIIDTKRVDHDGTKTRND